MIWREKWAMVIKLQCLSILSIKTRITNHETCTQTDRHRENCWAFTGPRRDFGLILLILNTIIHRSFTSPTRLLSANVRGPVSFELSANKTLTFSTEYHLLLGSCTLINDFNPRIWLVDESSWPSRHCMESLSTLRFWLAEYKLSDFKVETVENFLHCISAISWFLKVKTGQNVRHKMGWWWDFHWIWIAMAIMCDMAPGYGFCQSDLCCTCCRAWRKIM